MTAYRDSRPISPSCLEPSFPTQTTLQRSGLGVSSSTVSSTSWPILRSKLPRNRKPFFEESRTRQGSLFGLRSRLITRLARLFDTTRFDRRALVTGKLGILSLPGGNTWACTHFCCFWLHCPTTACTFSRSGRRNNAPRMNCWWTGGEPRGRASRLTGHIKYYFTCPANAFLRSYAQATRANVTS